MTQRAGGRTQVGDGGAMRWGTAVARRVLAASPLLLVVTPLRQSMEGQMTLHMLLQFPWLLICGAAAFGALGRPTRVAYLLARVDHHGLLTVSLVLCVSAVWMIPSALDLALQDGRVALAKYLSWYATGAMLYSGATRLRPELWAFLLGNLSWMLGTAGLLIREANTRVCVSYLAQDQLWAGTGLIVWALALSAWGVLRLRQVMARVEARDTSSLQRPGASPINGSSPFTPSG